MNATRKMVVGACLLLMSCATWAASAVLANVSSGDLVLGEWNSNFQAAKSYAEANGIPMLLFWSNSGCAQCNKMKSACNESDFVAWRQGRQLVMCFSEGDSTSKVFAKNSSGLFPYMRLYWPAGGVDLKFTGRSSTIPAAGSTLQAKLIAYIDTNIAGYNGNTNTPVKPVPPPTPVIGSEWNKARKLTAACYSADGQLQGRIEVKTGKVNKRTGKAKVSAKFMNMLGKSKSFRSTSATVDSTTRVSLSGTPGSASLDIHGGDVTGTFGNYTIVAKVVGGSTNGSYSFNVDGVPEKFDNYSVLAQFLPNGLTFTSSSSKWSLPRVGRVTSKGGTFVASNGNPAALKLSYKYSTGYFKGKFSVYAKKTATTTKKFTANVTGFIVDGLGEGVVTVRNVQPFSCYVLRNE